MNTAAAATSVLLLVTVFVSWGFNIFHTGVWFLRAALFLLLALALVWRLCLHIGQPRVRGVVAVLFAELLAVYAAGRLVSFYYQGESFNEEFFFHFNIETMKFAFGAFPGLISLYLVYVVLMGVCAWFSVYYVQAKPMVNRTLLILPGLFLVLAVDPDLFRLANISMQDANANRGLQLSRIDWEGTNLKREALFKMREDVVAGKNVVMIYLEGMERMYSDESVYPGLTPFINSLEGSALQFENMVQTRGTTFTVAGLLSSQCGTPLLFPSGPGGNDILKNGFLQEGFCFGDILNAAGYRQVFMGGASTRFAGKGIFLSAHGYEEVLGLEELQPLMSDPDYLNNWGLYDDTLLSLAADKFDELAADADQPFNFTVLTVDTHPPDGTVSESCTPYEPIDNNIFDAVHCTDQLLEKFVTHLQQSPAWDNTVVLLMSDHLHMRNTGMDYYPADYDRKLFVNVLNAGATGKIEARGAHMDIAPTLLGLMGVQHQQEFLSGDNLLSPEVANRDIYYNAPDRIAAIRYINTNLLSRLETGLCEAGPVYSYNEKTMRIAGREVDLSLRGREFPLETLGNSNVLLTMVSREGKVGLTFPLKRNNLDYVMFQFRENNFFLLAPSDVAQRLNPDIEAYAGLGLLFGNQATSFEALQTGLAMETGFTEEGGCGDLLSKAGQLDELNGVEALGKICDYTVPGNTVWDENNGTITLNDVAYADLHYQVVMERDDQGWYSVTRLVDLPPGEQSIEALACHAYYGNQEVLIPGIQTADGPTSMILDKVLGVPLTFTVGDVIPFPEAEETD